MDNIKIINMKSEDLFNNIDFDFKISIKINELNNSTNIFNILNIKIKEYENKCLEFGFIKKNSILIKKYSCGYLNPTIFVPYIEYKLLCTADIYHPQVNDIYTVHVISINKIGILCKLYYTVNNKKYILLNAIISKNNQNISDLNNIKINDYIKIKIIGYKFNKYSKFINAICNIVSSKELEQIKKYNNIINTLDNIDIPFKFINDKYKKYNNILKFILNKINISEKEVFIYNFLINSKIEITNKNYIQIYKTYLTSYINKLELNKNKNYTNNNINTKYYQIKKKTNNKDINDDTSYSICNDTDTEELDITSNNNDMNDIHDPTLEDFDDEEDDEDEENEDNDEDSNNKIKNKNLEDVVDNNVFEFDNQNIDNSYILDINNDEDEEEDDEEDDDEDDEDDEEDDEEDDDDYNENDNDDKNNINIKINN